MSRFKINYTIEPCSTCKCAGVIKVIKDMVFYSMNTENLFIVQFVDQNKAVIIDDQGAGVVELDQLRKSKKIKFIGYL